MANNSWNWLDWLGNRVGSKLPITDKGDVTSTKKTSTQEKPSPDYAELDPVTKAWMNNEGASSILAGTKEIPDITEDELPDLDEVASVDALLGARPKLKNLENIPVSMKEKHIGLKTEGIQSRAQDISDKYSSGEINKKERNRANRALRREASRSGVKLDDDLKGQLRGPIGKAVQKLKEAYETGMLGSALIKKGKKPGVTPQQMAQGWTPQLFQQAPLNLNPVFNPGNVLLEAVRNRGRGY